MSHQKALALAFRGVRSARQLHSSVPSRSTPMSSSPSMVLTDTNSPVFPPIFDIFDAPHQLGQSSRILLDQVRPKAERSRMSTFSGPRPRKTPSSLPPPMLFDGPAHPRSHFTLAEHRAAHGLTMKSPTPRRSRPHASIVESPVVVIEPLIELFDGPAKLSPYPSPTSRREKTSSYHLLLLCLGGAFGFATLTKQPPLNWMGFEDSETVF